MPALEINSYGIQAVETFGAYLHELLSHAESVKPARTLEPALRVSDFDDIYGRTAAIFADVQEGSISTKEDRRKYRQFATIETAARSLFGSLLATASIDSPDFVRVWNLFDILSILSDNGDCDAPLLFWLIEELLDSQTIAGCRTVFDYLESRRERITAKHFNSIKLVILRSCNDLLRRLSRAEDTPFCGRVFIFLFQVFPLGDKSSVNLRGEYHVENVTTFDKVPVPAKEEEKMDVDSAPADKPAAATAADENAVDFDALYPIFWSLQASFSQPKRLFDGEHFVQFKAGMQASLAAFQKICDAKDSSSSSRQLDELKRGIKRKRDRDDDLADTYNPKYLTSRDLFELETSDLTFRRHFLLQALIIMEFLLSLSPQAKEKLATATVLNKSVTYSDHVLSEEDATWANKMKHDITEHIKRSNQDGPYFLRMVDTILARDKNWVRWKVESCPSIELSSVSAEEFVKAKEGAQRAFARQQRRRNNAMPLGSFSMDFLGEDGIDEEAAAEAALERLALPERYALPEVASFRREIAEEDFEIEMPDSDQSKMMAEERKASKTWRALRIVRQTRLAMFDKIEDDSKIDAVYAEVGDDDNGDGTAEDGEELAGNGTATIVGDEPVRKDSLPSDTRPVVLSGPIGVGRRAMARRLMERNPGVFGLVTQHTTKPKTASAAAQSRDTQYTFVDSKEFNVLLDGDRLAAFGETGGFMYGTSKAAVAAVTETGKVPLVLMNLESAKENGFNARYLFFRPSSVADLETQLRDSGLDEAEVRELAEAATVTLEKVDGGGEGALFDKVLVGADVENTCQQFEDYVYEVGEGAAKEEDGSKEEPRPEAKAEALSEDAAMEDVGAGEDESKAA